MNSSRSKKFLPPYRSGFSRSEPQSIAAQSLSLMHMNPKQGIPTHAEAYHNASSTCTSVIQAEDIISSLGAAVANTEVAALTLKRKYDELVAHRDMIEQPSINQRRPQQQQQYEIDHLRREVDRLNNALEDKKNIIRDQQAELDRLAERAPPIYDKQAEDQLANFSDELSQWCGDLWDDNLIDKDVFWSKEFRSELLQISNSPEKLMECFPRNSRHPGLAPAKLLHSVIIHKVFNILIRPPMPGIWQTEGGDNSFNHVYDWMIDRNENKAKDFRRDVLQLYTQAEQKKLCDTIEQEIIKVLSIFNAGSQHVSDQSASIEKIAKQALNWKTRKFELVIVDMQFINRQLVQSPNNTLDLRKNEVLRDACNDYARVVDARDVHSVLEPGLVKFGDDEGRYSRQSLVWLPATVLCHEEPNDSLDNDMVWTRVNDYLN